VFAKNCWYVAAWASEIGSQELAGRLVAGEPIVLMRLSDGVVVAFEDRCSHRFAPLSKGRREGDSIRCMYHGLKFNCEGQCTEIPGQEAVSRNMGLHKYPVVERHGAVWIWLGNATLANPELIPAGRGPGDPDLTMRWDWLDYDVDYQLINDNLCDLSHVSYVHRDTLAMVGGDAWATSRPKLTTHDRGIRYERWFKSSPPPIGVTASRVDIWQVYEYIAPGILIMPVVFYAEGTAERCNFGPPPAQIEPLQDTYNFQAVTPMTERTTRYFFADGVGRYGGSTAMVEALHQLVIAAFQQDKEMITAQQQVLDRSPGRKMGPTVHDRAPNHLRLLIEKMLRAEQAA
jgi:phenylpropionate dioxygenase-like ring-hydroxylating dioxygenase large terminal subunit